MASKVDFKKTLDSYQAKHGQFRILDVPAMQYLMIDGHGDPNTSPSYADALAALYPIAYKLKFASKRELDRDYVVPPLEGLWWAEDMASFTTGRNKAEWDWTMMIMVPDWVEAKLVDQAREQAGKKNPPHRLDEVRFETLFEGQCVQTLHIGSYDGEADVLAEMHNEFIPSHSMTMTGKHHEIYLSDPRKVAPEKLRTILRQPVIQTDVRT